MLVSFKNTGYADPLRRTFALEFLGEHMFALKFSGKNVSALEFRGEHTFALGFK